MTDKPPRTDTPTPPSPRPPEQSAKPSPELQQRLDAIRAQKQAKQDAEQSADHRTANTENAPAHARENEAKTRHDDTSLPQQRTMQETTATPRSESPDRGAASPELPAEANDQYGKSDRTDAGDRRGRSEKIHSQYPDGITVHEGEQPSKIRGPDPAAKGFPHTVLKVDTANNRIYKAREYGEGGVPVRDIDFTHPTYPSGTPRPDHTAPEQHRYTPNDPDNPQAGYKRGPGEPLDS